MNCTAKARFEGPAEDFVIRSFAEAAEPIRREQIREIHA
jgi:hypothetical protein